MVGRAPRARRLPRHNAIPLPAAPRSPEERRAGEECRSRWPPEHQKKNRFYAGDTLELLCPAGSFPFRVESIALADSGEQVNTVSVAGQRVIIPLPHPAAAGDFLRGPNRNHQG